MLWTKLSCWRTLIAEALPLLELVGPIVREADELLLDSRAEHVAVVDDRVGRHFARELGVKVRGVDCRCLMKATLLVRMSNLAQKDETNYSPRWA